MSQGPTSEVAAAWGCIRQLPDWCIVGLFLAVGVILALTGQLDDWLRAALSVAFGLLAVAFASRIVMRHPGR